jgi:hypothetical protein
MKILETLLLLAGTNLDEGVRMLEAPNWRWRNSTCAEVPTA